MLTHLGLGLVVGIIMALTGAGGGILAAPLLIFGAHQTVVQAGPVGLLAVGLAAALGAVLGLRAGVVRYRAALLIAAVGMMLAPVGVWLAHRMDNRWLLILFAMVLLVVAYRAFGQGDQPIGDKPDIPGQPLPCVRNAESGRFIWTSACARALALSGSVAGLLSGLLGVGGGFVIVPALRRYSDLAMQSVVATSLAVIALVSISGVASSVVSGSLNWNIAMPFAIGALVGMVSGRAIASRVAGSYLHKGFAAVAAVVAIGMIMKVML